MQLDPLAPTPVADGANAFSKLPSELQPLLGPGYLPTLSEEFSRASHEGPYDRALSTGRVLLALYAVLYPLNYPQIGMNATSLPSRLSGFELSLIRDARSRAREDGLECNNSCRTIRGISKLWRHQTVGGCREALPSYRHARARSLRSGGRRGRTTGGASHHAVFARGVTASHSSEFEGTRR